MVTLSTTYHSYPPLSTAIHKEKKYQKEKVRQLHYYFFFFFFNFYTLKSKHKNNITTTASVTFLNELTGYPPQLIPQISS